ncbi:MAG: hydrolase [Desulfobacterales bacterium]|nr:hydrolase [Desulfobacterales bacterium]
MLTTANSALVLVDVQGKLAQAMHDKQRFFDAIIRLVKGALILELPILWNEQNPAGLGPTIPQIAELLTDQKPLGKLSFSCCGNAEFIKAIQNLARPNMLVAGIEAHVCVYQTAADLVDLNYNVQVVADAVASRTAENKQIGLEKSKQAGAGLTSTETVLFELLKIAKGEKFKEIINIVK